MKLLVKGAFLSSFASTLDIAFPHTSTFQMKKQMRACHELQQKSTKRKKPAIQNLCKEIKISHNHTTVCKEIGGTLKKTIASSEKPENRGSNTNNN
jgi:hypothetical protein